MIRIEEDKEFLLDQRCQRKMVMFGEDKELSKLEARNEARKQAERERKLKEEQRQSGASAIVPVIEPLHDESYSDDNDNDAVDNDKMVDRDFEIEIPVYYRQQVSKASSSGSAESSLASTPKRQCILDTILDSPDVSSTLDRINLSDTKFTILAAAIARAGGQNLDDGSLSRSTVRRKRTYHRSNIEATVRTEFCDLDKPPLIVHWDGKLMIDRTNSADPKANVDRLSVGVTGHNVDKILGIAKLSAGTGEAQAKAVIHLLNFWDIIGDVIGMSFDTTASNTGSKNGACVVLEKHIGRNLLYFACRHHVHEIIVAGVFGSLFGPSSGPNIPLFQRFQQYWPKVNQGNFKPLDDIRMKIPLVQELQNEVMAFLKENLHVKMPRDDYKEIMDLCLLILGKLPDQEEKNYHFKIPGAYHMARWMAKVIYCFKIYLFREEFKLTTKEEKNLCEFCLFASLVYVKSWISCPNASDAPVNDLFLFQQLKQFAVVNKTISEAAVKKFQNHLWYLSPELVPLALFSNKLKTEEKRKMISNMKFHGENWSERLIKLKNIESLEKKSLDMLVTSVSASALRSMKVDIDFLFNNDPATWNDSPEYQEGKNLVYSLKVVNDAAERSVALMSMFNESITRNESEMQRLIQVVEDHRKRVPDARKCTLKSYSPR